MKPRGPLMIEHRLIEKVLKLVRGKARSFDENHYDPIAIDTVVDFIKMYADRTHHGKEEDILFSALKGKKLDEKDARIMAELIEEHKQARAKVGEIVELNEKFKTVDRKAVKDIITCIDWLTAFYPVQIAKEDGVFFPSTEKYFSDRELNDILNAFWDFDRKMIHEKYMGVYEKLTASL